MERSIKPSSSYYTKSADITPEVVRTIEGTDVSGVLTVKTLTIGENILALEIFREKGLIDSGHVHKDHETTGYLIKGKLKMKIGDKEFVAGPGTAWIHPMNVEHQSEALEDCLQLEIKSPPTKTWA